MNLYSLFVERAMTLVSRPDALHGRAPHTQRHRVGQDGGTVLQGCGDGILRLKALYDFENKKVFFPDVHGSFKF